MWFHLWNFKRQAKDQDDENGTKEERKVESNVHDVMVDWLSEFLRFIDIWLKIFFVVVHVYGHMFSEVYCLGFMTDYLGAVFWSYVLNLLVSQAITFKQMNSRALCFIPHSTNIIFRHPLNSSKPFDFSHITTSITMRLTTALNCY